MGAIDADTKLLALKEVVKTMGDVHWPHVDETSVRETVARLFDRFRGDRTVISDEKAIIERETEQYENEQKRT